MTDHLSEIALNALIDNELSATETAAIEAHLAACPACTTRALSHTLLKSRTAQAGHRYALPPQLLNRLQSGAANPAAATSPSRTPWAAAIAAILIVIAAMTFIQRRDAGRVAATALTTELIDQHVTALAASQPPQVLSSDRHTVKPWFQGRIPFSFNLPETLPADTTLDGANLDYLDHRPVAQLLYSIGKHRISVFIREPQAASPKQTITPDRSGFHLRSFHTTSLDVIAVSDVEPSRLDALVDAIRDAQTR